MPPQDYGFGVKLEGGKQDNGMTGSTRHGNVAVSLAAAEGMASPPARRAQHHTECTRTARNQPCQDEHSEGTLRRDSPT